MKGQAASGALSEEESSKTAEYEVIIAFETELPIPLWHACAGLAVKERRKGQSAFESD
ncbi:MAG: hypothetical protein J6B53_05890 [Clostridia bacterium]|nr:hypothetical protein [Clostridia bacterium]